MFLSPITIAKTFLYRNFSSKHIISKKLGILPILLEIKGYKNFIETKSPKQYRIVVDN